MPFAFVIDVYKRQVQDAVQRVICVSIFCTYLTIVDRLLTLHIVSLRRSPPYKYRLPKRTAPLGPFDLFRTRIWRPPLPLRISLNLTSISLNMTPSWGQVDSQKLSKHCGPQYGSSPPAISTCTCPRYLPIYVRIHMRFASVCYRNAVLPRHDSLGKLLSFRRRNDLGCRRGRIGAKLSFFVFRSVLGK